MISVVDAGDDEVGATVVGKGLMEYEIVGEPPAIALTLLRAVGDLSRNDLATRPSGHAGPPVATPAAQCIGRHVFEMAFEPRGGAPAAGEMLASARAHLIAPRVVVAMKPGGSAPTTRSFLSIERQAGGIVLSALKHAEDRANIVVRLFNPGNDEARATLRTDESIAQAFAVNLLEERQGAVALANGIEVRLKPHQIQTIEIVRQASDEGTAI